MAMQDAIALYEALGETGRVKAALERFEEKRRESSGDFSEAARRSLDWYETVKERMDLDPVSFAYSYMTRTGRVTHDKLKERDPELVAAYERKKQSASRPAR
jgi:2-polyprenyl-6-methoxyphenol hydroxylase-like FAD-dependent oxidoreductase